VPYNKIPLMISWYKEDSTCCYWCL